MNYKDSKWIKKRETTLRNHNYLCQESKRYGKNIEAEMVHHIYPAEQYPDLKYEDWNLLPLTKKMHDAMHDRKSHRLTDRGEYWKKKRRREYKRWMKENGKEL